MSVVDLNIPTIVVRCTHVRAGDVGRRHSYIVTYFRRQVVIRRSIWSRSRPGKAGRDFGDKVGMSRGHEIECPLGMDVTNDKHS